MCERSPGGGDNFKKRERLKGFRERLFFVDNQLAWIRFVAEMMLADQLRAMLRCTTPRHILVPSSWTPKLMSLGPSKSLTPTP